jgi:phage host-nuclease inhibitor protein Gam
VNLVPYFENKSIVKVWSGFYYYIVLSRSEDVLKKWDTSKVLEWLKKEGFDDFINIMRTEKVDGKKLLEMDKKYMADVLGITNSNVQQKMVMSIQQHQ